VTREKKDDNATSSVSHLNVSLRPLVVVYSRTKRGNKFPFLSAIAIVPLLSSFSPFSLTVSFPASVTRSFRVLLFISPVSGNESLGGLQLTDEGANAEGANSR